MHSRHLSLLAIGLGGLATSAPTLAATITETVYVETTLDTDSDGRPDRIHVEVSRPDGGHDLPTIYVLTPYAEGGNDAPNHDVDVATLPQDETQDRMRLSAHLKERLAAQKAALDLRQEALRRGYAYVYAHSIGTGQSTGCPTVGDQAETLAAKAVIDWLGGRARAVDAGGREVRATWANGSVGMTGTSYVGTLPNMVATTGVEGLKAIVPVSAISSWYDYYRANGLVVGPGGYIGEDADVLGQFIVRSGACRAEVAAITRDMGRETGDYTSFWRDRDYVAQAGNVRAAVFIMHGQADWNVRQRHAIQWYEALSGHVPLRMWLHKGGHGGPSRSDTTAETFAWFDHYVKGIDNGVERKPPVEVESPDGQWTTQQAWPSELTQTTQYYLDPGNVLAEAPTAAAGAAPFVDQGKTVRLETLLANPSRESRERLAFVTAPLTASRLLSGTPKIRLRLAVRNRRAANLTVALIAYDRAGRGTVVTRGWADPQNHADLTQGELLEPGRFYDLAFDLEPKQYTFASGSRIGVVVMSTDYDYTLRPDVGTELSLDLGAASSIELGLSR
jgi:X-Pro dipeptidyl-peptidase